ncbi:MAG TPA: NAD-binding protein [Erysipelotrichaceae bacterium]|jgi:trk system potassium uptake protein TrkA|nr:TrkA family potassium uptake protein [Erysipelotrichia bacterium]HPX32358.1 NAD-binding protein [Erysipelotrichaceae bacterium]HQA85121.1 NAD-binding protein [Erysipelotrichaceae bacterium]
MHQRIFIVGNSLEVKSLAQSLNNKKYPITVISTNMELCKELSQEDNIVVVFGEGDKRYVLEDADISKCNIMIAMTENDADNLVICLMAKKIFKVKKIISLVSDVKKTHFFYQMGIDSVVCTTSTITTIVEQKAIMDELATMIPIGEGRVRISEIKVNEDSPILNKTLFEINLPAQSIIACILREQSSIIPRGSTQILANDILLLVASNEDEMKAIEIITGKKYD